MKLVQIISLLCAGLVVISCDRNCERLDGPREIYERPLGTITSMELNTPAILSIEKDSSAFSMIEVVAQPEVNQVLFTNVRNGHCEINMESCFRDQLGLLLTATVKDLRSLQNTAAGDIRTIEMLEQDTIEIKNAGLGDIDLLMRAEKVTAVVESSGNIILSGDANKLEFVSFGSGELLGFNFFVDTVIVYTLGSGLTDVYASDYLEVNFLQPSTVQYRGTPAEIVVNGEGNLKDANL